MARYGIMGGSFNPVHIAHLITAEEVRHELGLDKIIFIPAANHPLKDNPDIPNAQIRMEMLQLAIKDNPSFEASDIEIKLPQDSKSYTVNTLTALRELYKDKNVKLYLILGVDNLIELDKWKEPEKLFELSEVVAVNRPGFNTSDIKNEYHKLVTYVTVPNLDVSSKNIRLRIKENKSIKYLVPQAVENYIKQHKLYL